MKSDDNKNREQNLVLQAWKDSKFIGTAILYTGCGKTRIGTIAASEFIRRDPNEKALVVVPTTNLRDNEWEKSFTDWGYQRERPNVQIECIQSAYKITGKHYNTIVIDEYHSALTQCYIDVLKNNTYDRLLCLTATLNEDKIEFAKQFAPVIWETNRERAISLKLVSESMIFNFGVNLTESEQIAYDHINGEFTKYETELGGNMRAFENSGRFLRLKGINYSGSNMRVYKPENRVIYATDVNDITIPSNLCRELTSAEVMAVKTKIHASNMYWEMMRKRRATVIIAQNKIGIVKALCERYSDRKGIIFSESIPFADSICEAIGDKCRVYHSKVTPPRMKTQALLDFSDNTAQYLSSVKALNAGFDVPECSLGIGTSGDSKKLSYVQRNGRISRYIDGKVSYYFNLYCLGTQELNWVRNGTKLMQPKWVTSIEEAPIN